MKEASTLKSLAGSIRAMSLAERIREAMGDMSAADLARAAKVTGGAVTQWLDGTTKSLRADKAALLEAATGYRASWIVTGRGPKRVEDAPGVPAAMEPYVHVIRDLEDIPPGPRQRLLDEIQAVAEQAREAAAYHAGRDSAKEEPLTAEESREVQALELDPEKRLSQPTIGGRLSGFPRRPKGR